MEALVDALYSRFLLRDVFGKVVPGLLLIFTLAAASTSAEAVKAFVFVLPFGGWLALFGLAWIVAFAVQSFGEWGIVGRVRLFGTYPQDFDDKKWHALLTKFRRHQDYSRHRVEFERLVVVKEACGNGSLSLALSTVLWFADRWLETSSAAALQDVLHYVHIVAIDLGLIVYLFRMHVVNTQRQYALLESVVGKCDTGQ